MHFSDTGWKVHERKQKTNFQLRNRKGTDQTLVIWTAPACSTTVVLSRHGKLLLAQSFCLFSPSAETADGITWAVGEDVPTQVQIYSFQCGQEIQPDNTIAMQPGKLQIIACQWKKFGLKGHKRLLTCELQTFVKLSVFNLTQLESLGTF